MISKRDIGEGVESVLHLILEGTLTVLIIGFGLGVIAAIGWSVFKSLIN